MYLTTWKTWNYRDELTVESGILIKSHKFILPKNLQSVYMNKIHAGHLGINKSLLKAQEYLFWKGYIKEIIEMTSLPTLEISMILDYFSKFLIVRKLPNSTTGAIVKELSITFSEYGIPFIIRSDNGPYYSLQESKTFVRDLYHVSKNLIEKAIQSDKPWHSFIQEYRITPLSSTIPSLAEILFGRRFRSNLSILPSQLTNSRTAYIHEEITKKENKLHEKPTPVADLVPGQPIWHQDPLTKKWLPGAVQEKLEAPHSYCITLQDTTALYRRNRNHLKPQQVPDAPANATITVPQENISKDEQATFAPHTNDSIQPSEETCTTVQHISSRSTKGTFPKRYRTEQWTFMLCTSLIHLTFKSKIIVYWVQFQVQQKYCLEGDSDPTFLSCPHSSPTAELHISVRKSPRRKTNSMKSQLQLQILCQDNLYGIRIHSPRNGEHCMPHDCVY